MTFLVAELVGAGFEYLEVIVAWQPFNAVGAGHPHLVFRLGIVRLELSQGQRPVEQVGALDLAIMCQRLELVLLEAQGRTGPVCRRAAHCLDDPGGQVGKVLRDAPAAASRAVVKPGKLGKTVPFVVDEILVFNTRTGLEHDDVDALLRQLVAERPAAGTRTDDDDHTVVVEIIRAVMVSS